MKQRIAALLDIRGRVLHGSIIAHKGAAMSEPGNENENAKLLQVRQVFSAFLEANTGSSIETVTRGANERIAIKKPWGEDGLVIYVPDDPADLASALNNLLLPPALTAVYHRDMRSLEVIWTAYTPKDSSRNVFGRKFVFAMEGRQYECEFGRASERLLLMAETAIPVGVSETQHRNLQSFYMYAHWQLDIKKAAAKQAAPPDPPQGIGQPTCFWIKELDWNDDAITKLVRHLNFYMTYFDSASPYILMWPPKADAWNSKVRFLHGEFPTHIDSQPIDDILLQFWIACKSGDSGKAFVYYYRIIEAA
ncbi:MAG TPA: hypothetical protein VHW69_11010, partial [Rhizomicrobium sp.]|nr:hypothetical protein [Rhizomicrobium sp.]